MARPRTGSATKRSSPAARLDRLASARDDGDASAFQKIFDANRDILKAPDVIHPGQVLKIPHA